MKRFLFFLFAFRIWSLDFSAVKEALSPIFTSEGVYRQGNFPAQPESILLLVYDRDDSEAVKQWFTKNHSQVLADSRPYLHLLFPGGVTFLATTAAVQKKVGDKIREAMQETRIRVGETDWDVLSKKPVLYYLDRKKSLIRRLGLTSGFYIYAIDFNDGTVKEVFRQSSQPENPKTSETTAISEPRDR